MRSVVVVAFWAGPRRNEGFTAPENLNRWEWAMSHYKHEIDTIVLVSNRSEQDDTVLYRELMEFRANIPVLVLRRDNRCGSYGAWKDAWKVLGYEYDYYYVFEDDYIPGTDHWDSKLLWCMQEQDSDYCGARLGFPQYEEHMGHACGLITERALAAVKVTEDGYHIYDAKLQIGFGQDVLAAGYKLSHFADKYRVPFAGSGGYVHELGNPEAAEALIVPTWTK